MFVISTDLRPWYLLSIIIYEKFTQWLLINRLPFCTNSKKILISRKGINTPNAIYTMEQKTNYDPLYLITAAQNLSVGAAVATGTLCLKQVVNVIRSTISYFNENCVFTTFFSMSEANRSTDYTLSFCWMVTIQPTR